uniref:Olfactory receptor C family, u1 n=1 Tax=Nothobranchius furzeri TaxID=105023 RepID=A0A8C6KCF4_NOTFU
MSFKVNIDDFCLSQCVQLKGFKSLALEQEGDVVIGGLFPLHFLAPELQQSYHSKPQNTACSGFDHRAFRWMMTMAFAVEEINNKSDLLPGIKLGYRIMDSCDSIHTSLQAFFSLVSFSTIVSTQLGSSTCVSDSPIPVSYFATCTCLSDKQIYPSFLRTVPSDFFQVKGLVQLVTFFGWFWVGTIGTTDDYSRYGIQAFSDQFGLKGGCVEYRLTIPASPTTAEIQEITNRLKSSTTQVVVAFATEGQLLNLFLEVRLSANLQRIQWVASEAWVTAKLLTQPHFHHLLEGTLGFSFPGVRIPGLKEFLLNVQPSPKPGMEIINMFWQEQFGCKLKFEGDKHENVDNIRPVCTGSEDLSLTSSSYTDVSQVRISYNVYKAVFAIAHALHALLHCDSAGSYNRTFSKCPIKQVLKIVSKGSTECIKCPEFYWSDEDKVKCVAGVEEFLSYNETMGIILVALSLLGVILTIIITIVFHHFRTTPIVKANNSEISFLLLLSLKLCFLCSLVFIGQPSVWTCMLRQAAFGISFVVCLSCLLVKTIVVLLAFRANVPDPKGLRMFGPSQQRIMIFCTTVPQVEGQCNCWLTGAHPFPFRNPTFQSSNGKIFVECKEPWPVGFYLVLGYIGLISFVCLLLAFLGRKLPDTFNEAKLITFSMLIFMAVWISFIPAYISSPGKFSVAVEIFAILASSFGLLLCIFVPKCYIILLHPERNIKKGLTGKHNR